jgi:hypothetical protein
MAHSQPSSAISDCDRSERFLQRVDVHLAPLDLTSKRKFLRNQINRWERRYHKFESTQGASERVRNYEDPPHRSDFIKTIAGLSTRLCLLDGNELTMTTYTRRPLEKTIMSLLVAADQCCPAIIGQAHILYHCTTDVNRRVSTLNELKTAAQNLLQAITAAEQALQTCKRNEQPSADNV